MSECRFINELKEIDLNVICFGLFFAFLVLYAIGPELICMAVVAYRHMNDEKRKDCDDDR